MSGNVQKKRSLAVLLHLIFQLGKILKVNFSFEHSFLQYHDLIEHNQAHDLIYSFEFWCLKSKHNVLNDWPINLIISIIKSILNRNINTNASKL